MHHWHAHHSDGVVDWPPSPWRLLRTLVAVAGRGLTSLPAPLEIGSTDIDTDAIPRSRLAALLEKLSALPVIWLPRTSFGHTRHFFALGSGTTGSAVFDTFAAVSKREPLVYEWSDTVLDEQEKIDLVRLLQRMTYFGRAESWCDAALSDSLAASITPQTTHWRCTCTQTGAQEGREHRDYAAVRKLAALPLRDGSLDHTRELLATPPPGRRNGTQQAADQRAAEYLRSIARDELLLRCLLRESGDDIKSGVERPIGTRWVHYAVPREIYQLPPRRMKMDQSTDVVTTTQVVRFSLNTASLHRAVLPALTDTLLVADKFRAAAQALYGKFHEGHSSPRLSGKAEFGEPVKEHAMHTYFWPTDEDNDGFIDHLTAFCKAGLWQSDLRALTALQRMRQRGGQPDLLVTPVYLGSAINCPAWQGRPGTVFRSATPYFSPVHLTHGKRSGGKTRPVTPVIVAGLREAGLLQSHEPDPRVQEIVYDYMPEELSETHSKIAAGELTEPVPPRQFFPVIDPPAEFPPLASSPSKASFLAGASLKDPDAGYPFGLRSGLFVAQGTKFIPALAFCRRRRLHQVKGSGRMFRIDFCSPRRAQPFAIGDQAHFGLGLFVPERS